jgi:ankyrin repeat protein
MVIQKLSISSFLRAQTERIKDTALSLACSSGCYEVVEVLLSRGANKEHRNVSDYTPLSLAASGGYVTIINLLLSYGAEINSRTGSKLGISPLMLAAMNGHTETTRLLLDRGSYINAYIETNSNTIQYFRSKQEITRCFAHCVDEELNKEATMCAEILHQTKERQAAKTAKNAAILSEEINQEKNREEGR